VIVLVGIAFVAGLVTAISPCVLPVLPLVFAGGAAGGPRRPFAVVTGLVLGFTAFTLTTAALLGALGLPEDLLRNVAIGVVLLVGLSLLVPALGRLVGRPFEAVGRRPPGDIGGGLVLGLSLGLLFTPCAGPIIAAVATVAATERFSIAAVVVTLAYAAGAGAVLLTLALAVRRGLNLAPLRRHAPLVRRVLGAVAVSVAVLMALGLDTRLQTRVPGYTRALQGLEESAPAATRIERLVGGRPAAATPHEALKDLGVAPELAGISKWFNSTPLTLAALRGKVVLVDFWTYSCINCLRTLPYLERWDETYRDNGLVILGIHTPEFAFERDPGNVRHAIAELGIEYPVALDPDYATWKAWANRYWPAEYFVDRTGHVRYVHFGEGEYAKKEAVIRKLLAETGLPGPVSGRVADRTPTGPQTPETYLGYSRLANIVGSPIKVDREATYELPGWVPRDAFGLGGRWTLAKERAIAGPAATLRLRYRGRHVYLVLGPGARAGTVRVALDGRTEPTIRVTHHGLYELASSPGPSSYHLLELRLSPGVAAYAFTFG